MVFITRLQDTRCNFSVLSLEGVAKERQCTEHVKTRGEGLIQTPAGNTSRLVNRSNEIC